MNSHSFQRITFLSSITLLTLAVYLPAATVPSSWDFGDDPGKDDGSEFTTVGSPVTTEADSIRFSRESGGLATFGNLVSFSDLGGGNQQDFQASLTFTFTSVDSTNFSRFGMLVLADDAASSEIEGTGVYAELIFLSDGTMDLGLRTGTLGTRFASAAWAGDTRSTVTGRTITMDLSATYDEGNLLLNLSATDSNGYTQSVPTATVLASNYDGTFFGMASRMAGGSTIDFDQFSVIPEPSTYAAILGLLVLGVVAWRRRRG